MSTPRFSSVDDYLSKQDPVKARTMRAVIDLILAQSPDLESKIAWNVPMIHRGGKYVAGIDAFKKHLTFAPWSQQIMADFKANGRLGKFVVFKNCFQIPVDWEIDETLIKDMVCARLAELEHSLEK
ncbi:MAG: iron chaperone [Prosthecobacter sp.]